MTEAEFLITTAVKAYNEQYGQNFNPADFCVTSINPRVNYTHGYEVMTMRTDDFLRLRMYVNIGLRDSVGHYRLEVNYPNRTALLGDEVFVALGDIDRYYVESGMYKFNPINTCGISIQSLADEANNPFISETGDFFVTEISN